MSKKGGNNQGKPAAEKKLSNNPDGRPDGYDKKHLKTITNLAIIGVTEADIAWYIGVDPATLRRWKKKYPEICAALKKGHGERNVRLTTALFTTATRRGNVAAQIFLAKNWLGMKDKHELGLPEEILDEEGDMLIKIVHVNGAKPPRSKGKAKGKSKPVPKPQPGQLAPESVAGARPPAAQPSSKAAPRKAVRTAPKASVKLEG